MFLAAPGKSLPADLFSRFSVTKIFRSICRILNPQQPKLATARNARGKIVAAAARDF
jgi:hypothetical protein